MFESEELTGLFIVFIVATNIAGILGILAFFWAVNTIRTARNRELCRYWGTVV